MFVHVIAGTDTYGRVKEIQGVPIVTKFAMLQMFPLYPIESVYYFGQETSKIQGIPFLAEFRETPVNGITLAKLDNSSVMMTYLRGIFGAFALIGFMGSMIPAINYLMGEHMDEMGVLASKILVALFFVGVIGGVLSYFVPLLSHRERRIRELCSEVLDIAIDPAKISPEDSAAITAYFEISSDGFNEREKLIISLIAARVEISLKNDVFQMERETDILLTRLV